MNSFQYQLRGQYGVEYSNAVCKYFSLTNIMFLINISLILNIIPYIIVSDLDSQNYVDNVFMTKEILFELNMLA